MPVLIDRGAFGYGAFGQADRLRAPPRVERGGADTDAIDIAFVNNMPDKALEATERQFLKLIDAAAGNVVVRVKFHALPDVPRTDWGQHHLRAHYSPIGELWNGRYDGLIVTGTEPRAGDLADEPYWPTLAGLVDWADENVASAVWSCLAAHAAVLHMDGIRRRTLGDKCFGLFECTGVADHVLTQGVEFPLWMPHSRWNDLPADELTAGGYEVLTRSARAGVDTFVKRRKSLFVFVQGHPEYEPETLLREYRRDVGRFLKGERATYPAIPQSYLDEAAAARLTAFRERALAQRRADLIAEFPMARPAPTQASSWRNPAARIFRNWLSVLTEHKAQAAGRGRCRTGRRSALRR